MLVATYHPELAQRWDEFCAHAPMATFLHTRRFLSHHGERFHDLSAVLHDDRGHLVGLFPAAEDPADSGRVVSHPGITFGGLIHDGRLVGTKAIAAMEALSRHYRELGYSEIRYKAVPHIYHVSPSCDDLYALFRLGAQRYRCDLSCAIDLTEEPRASSRRTRGRRKARKAGVEVRGGPETAELFWNILVDALGRKHGVRPVHSVEEIIRLHAMFPDNIEFITGFLAGEVVAGVVLFHSTRVTHAQYIASSASGEACGALDLLFHESITVARAVGRRYFDFGISNEREGWLLNDGLYAFKSEFGGGGVVHEFYGLSLEEV